MYAMTLFATAALVPRKATFAVYVHALDHTL